MPEKKLLFIYNTHAGTGQIAKHLVSILDIMTRAGYTVTVHPTQARYDAIAAASKMAPAYDLVVCSGGDGTLSETAAGLMRLPEEERPPLAYIPAGSTNDCAKNLRLPRGMVSAAQAAVNGTVQKIDIGRLNGQPFIYVAAFGIFTDVSYSTPQSMKNRFGHSAYLAAALNEVSSMKSYPLHIEYDGGVLDDDFVLGLVCNTYSVGGIATLPATNINLADGLFEVLLVRNVDNVIDAGTALQEILSWNLEKSKKLLFLRSKTLKVESKDGAPIPWTIDGEYGGSFLCSTVENEQRALRVVIGERRDSSDLDAEDAPGDEPGDTAEPAPSGPREKKTVQP